MIYQILVGSELARRFQRHLTGSVVLALELRQEQRTISARPSCVIEMKPGSCIPATRVCFLLAHGLPSYMTLVLFDDLRQGRLRLGQPGGYVHSSVEGDGGGQGSASLLALCRRKI